MRVIDLTVEELMKEIETCVNKCLQATGQNATIQEDSERVLTIKEAADYLSLALPTMYTMTSKKTIPFLKRGKRLYFLKKDLNKYLEEGRSKTRIEILQNADSAINAFLIKSK